MRRRPRISPPAYDGMTITLPGLSRVQALDRGHPAGLPGDRVRLSRRLARLVLRCRARRADDLHPEFRHPLPAVRRHRPARSRPAASSGGLLTSFLCRGAWRGFVLGHDRGARFAFGRVMGRRGRHRLLRPVLQLCSCWACRSPSGPTARTRTCRPISRSSRSIRRSATRSVSPAMEAARARGRAGMPQLFAPGRRVRCSPTR